MKLSHIFFLIGCSVFGFTGCDEIDEADRFDGPISVEAKKNVLVEDFTGQKCSNCPLAADAVKSLQATYGKERVISVAIHGGPLSVSEAQSPKIGLANEQSLAYNNYWKVEGYPAGLIDRQGGLQDFEKWAGAVVGRFSVAPKVELALDKAEYNAETRQLDLKATVKGLENVTGKLQVWLTESNIVRIQAMPDRPDLGYNGGNNKEYVHNHVFRASVNDAFGDEMTLEKDGEQSKTYTYTLNEKWNSEHMSVVVFFYNETDGVMQVIDYEI